MEKTDELFDWKHLRLWRISSLADVFATIAVIVFVLLAISEVFQYNTFARNQFQTNLIGLFSQQPLYILDVLLQMARVFLQGVVYYLVLKAVSIGLNMIVETDINYREKQNEEGADE